MKILRALVSIVFATTISCTNETPKEKHDDIISLENPKDDKNVICEEDEQRSCHITLGQHEGVISCFVGIQKCIDGEWSQCSDVMK